MGQDNVVTRRINGVEGALNDVIISQGPGVLEIWGPMAGGAGGDAVITVAANNTPAAQKARADFACGGANDDATIEAHVAAGVTIKLMVGDYVFNAALDILVSNFRLEGSGKGTVIAGVIATNYINIGNDGTLVENVTICDLAIDGTSQTSGHGIFLDGHASYHINNCRIANCRIENCDDDGIHTEYAQYCEITDNWCESNGTVGIFLALVSDYNTITGNTCILQHDGIELSGSDDNTVVGNTCYDNSFTGIYLSYALRNTITGNTCYDNDSSGIWLFNSTDNAITGNTCYSNSAENICLNNNSHRNAVTGNDCSTGGNYGIDVNGSDNVTISGNNIIANYGDEGIRLQSSSNSNITGNVVIGNGDGMTKRSGIWVVYSNNCTIDANTCNLNGLHGIYLQTSDYCTVVGNTCNGQLTGDGIRIMGDGTGNSDFNFLTGNTCYDNPGYGINIVGGTDANENRVINNKLIANTTAEFADAGVDTQLATYVVPFVDGTDPQDSGYLIDATTEMARAYLRLPPEVQQVVRVEVYARAKTLEVHEMELEMVVKGGADNEPYATHDGSIAALDSISVNFAADDVIFWRNTEAGTLALLGGDSVEVRYYMHLSRVTTLTPRLTLEPLRYSMCRRDYETKIAKR